MQGLGYLAAIAAAGLGLAALGVLLLRKRQMETAGEIVAVPVLRPVFRVCMAVGCALVGAAIANEALLGVLLSGRALAAALAVTLCVCAFVGFFAAQMLMKKTLRVFRGGWKQLGVICACLVLLVVLAKADVTGYETRVPAADEIACVHLNNSELYDAESVALCCETHRALIANKSRDEGSVRRQSMTLNVDYSLKNGRHFSRRYRVPVNDGLESDPTSSIMRWQALSNCPEAVLQRAGARRAVTAEKVRYASVTIRRPADDPRYGWTGEELRLTPGQAESLWHEGILPDAREGNIARWFAFGGEQQREGTNVSISIEREEEPVPTPDGLSYYYDADAYLFLDVLESSVNTRRWLQQNLGITTENLYKLEQASEGMYKQ
jgi:ABC-2 type transport system permease protein